LAAAVAEKRFGNRFLAADLNFVRELIGRIADRQEVRSLVDSAASQINAIHKASPTASAS
jgi:hypothetical protein